jgi:hypothetical protein
MEGRISMIESETMKRSVETMKTNQFAKESPDKTTEQQMVASYGINPFEMAEEKEEQQTEDILIKRKNIL